ncbi:hypothetical protein SLEP1_g17117 [Rubroshorea leprosula]|uniref:protein-serine/threonine phosphatase n=1 Tax=Rubroshorea leprosula TaxID=152421 RepID=A0AAV5IYR9_9ROSI|nr:hypothetical protein SLEP1_g17117 [Rubroshorea leprosula]
MRRKDGDDSPLECRERRRRRIEMRRLSSVSISSSVTQPSLSESSILTEDVTRLPTSESDDLLLVAKVSASSIEKVEPETERAEVKLAAEAEPVFGMMSIAGRSREMEDTVSVRTNLCRPEMNHSRPVHFFAVYDGHGGAHVAASCKERMHVFVEEELMRVEFTDEKERGENGSSVGEENEGKWRTAMKRSFERMDEVAMNTCACGSVGYRCGCHSMEVALGGSTAVVVLLTDEHILVANCGDSRAVLCRAGKAIPLSFDHKPDRSDELERIKGVGGRVIFLNGARVEGILAMSRAIGDKYLKPVVTSEPEITFTKREPQDECLILASDGLWDVLSSDLACEVALECLKERSNGVGGAAASATAFNHNARPQIVDEGAEALYPSRSAMAAALLTRLALGRKSSDNISVIVIDLKRS